mgnify:CR=1 FL=1
MPFSKFCHKITNCLKMVISYIFTSAYLWYCVYNQYLPADFEKYFTVVDALSYI